MANTYYDSQLTAEEIEAALEAIDGVITPSNNGKVLAIEDGSIVAKSVSEWTDTAVLVNKTITANGTYDPADDSADGYSGVIVNVSGENNITKIEMTSCPQQCYLYAGGNRGWAVYPTASGAENAETFYANIPSTFRNGGMIVLSTERPSGATYEFTRNRIGFTDGTEDVTNLPNGQIEGNTTPPSFYMNAMSQDKTKQFSFVRVPNGMARVYWTNTQSLYRVAGQKSYMWLISDSDLLSALNIDWRYYINDSVNSEGTNEAWVL